MLRCPTCGTKLEITEIAPLTARQRAILDTIEIARRDSLRGTARTRDIAVRIGVSLATVKNELAHLEELGVIERPSGRKSGWARKRERLALVKAA